MCYNILLLSCTYTIDIMENEYKNLCQAVEHRADRKMQTPRDFDFLSVCVEQITHRHIGVNTLKRLWGYISNEKTSTPRQYTIDTLAQYVGYKNYDDFAQTSIYANDVDSDFITSPTLNVPNISIGTHLRITWHPDRIMMVRYEGDNTFIVEKVENSKLMVGDCFCCDQLTQNEPLFLYNLIHDGNKPTGYVCGRLGGIRYNIIND